MHVTRLVEEAGAEDDVRAENNAGQTVRQQLLFREIVWALRPIHASYSSHASISHSLLLKRVASTRQPLDVACRDERVHVAVWLLLRGAANDDTPAPQAPLLSDAVAAANDTGPHVTTSSLRLALRRAQPLSEFRTALAKALGGLLADHSNFIRLVLPAVSIPPQLHLAADAAAAAANASMSSSRKPSSSSSSSPSSSRRSKEHRLANEQLASSSWAALRGLESTVLILVADFVGVVRGRRLRNLREVATGLAILQAEDENEEAAARRRSLPRATFTENGIVNEVQGTIALSADAALAMSDPKARGGLLEL